MNFCFGVSVGSGHVLLSLENEPLKIVGFVIIHRMLKIAQNRNQSNSFRSGELCFKIAVSL